MTVAIIASTYASIGLAVAIAFLLAALDRIDPAAHGAWAFRPLLVPGLVLLWPLVAWRWYTFARRNPAAEQQTVQRAAHAIVWMTFAVLLPALFAGAMALRSTAIATDAPVRLGVAGAKQQ